MRRGGSGEGEKVEAKTGFYGGMAKERESTYTQKKQREAIVKRTAGAIEKKQEAEKFAKLHGSTAGLA